MKYLFLIKESLQSLRHNILRSLLTVIGIVVGIISVTTMLGLGAGLSDNITDRFSAFATGDLSISGDLKYTDLEWINDRPYVSATLAEKSVAGTTVIVYSSEFSPSITSVVGDYAEIQKYELLDGEVFDTQSPNFSDKVLVISQDFQEAVSEETGQKPTLGHKILVDGQQYEIVGIIDIETAGFNSGDGSILIPYQTTIGTLSGTDTFSSISILLEDSSYFEVAGVDILSGLNASRNLSSDSTDSFSAQTAQSIIETIQETANIISIFLGVIGGIALFVGGIGTMNMMLTSVTERTKEIGLRKAVGARDRDILLQILIESVFITTFGGVVGIIITVIGSYFANQFLLSSSSSISIIISWNVILTAFCVSMFIGVIFGIYPSRNASKLQPVDALRSD